MAALLATGCAVVRMDTPAGSEYRMQVGAQARFAQAAAPESPWVYLRSTSWGLVVDDSMLALGRVDLTLVQVTDPQRCQSVILVADSAQAQRLAQLGLPPTGICVVEPLRRKE